MNQHVYRRRPVDDSAIPTVIFWLLIINGLVFALQQFMPVVMEVYFALSPLAMSTFAPWQLLTYGFLHGGPMHIFFNMFALWMFGRELERIMGPKRFLIYFLTCVVGAGIVQLIVLALTGDLARTMGASGGVFGILLAYGMAFPNNTVMLLFPPIPMKAKYFVILFGLLELYFGVSRTTPGIANFAHLGGMLFGFLLLQYWRRFRSP